MSWRHVEMIHKVWLKQSKQKSKALSDKKGFFLHRWISGQMFAYVVITFLFTKYINMGFIGSSIMYIFCWSNTKKFKWNRNFPLNQRNKSQKYKSFKRSLAAALQTLYTHSDMLFQPWDSPPPRDWIHLLQWLTALQNSSHPQKIKSQKKETTPAIRLYHFPWNGGWQLRLCLCSLIPKQHISGRWCNMSRGRLWIKAGEVGKVWLLGSKQITAWRWLACGCIWNWRQRVNLPDCRAWTSTSLSVLYG